MRADQIISYLSEWTVNYLRSKDVFLNEIVDIIKNDSIHVKFKNEDKFFLLIPTLENIDTLIEVLRDKPTTVVVALNSKPNFQFLIENWKRIVDFKQFSIIFLNPFSASEKKWVINPYTHNKICDPASLKAGLKSIFDTVDAITEAEFKSLISSARK